MGELFFGKQYDVPQGMSPSEFEGRLSEWKEKTERREFPDAAEMFLKTKGLIEGITLNPEYFGDKNENESILEERKRYAMLRLDDLVNRYVANYAASINRYNKANIPGDERNQEEFLQADSSRTSAHNALMEHIRGTIRYIRDQFSVLSEGELDDIEERLESKGQALLPVNRVVFPGGPEKIFLPRYADLAVRETITQWVKDIRNYLSTGSLR